jgi:hypothetical protein
VVLDLDADQRVARAQYLASPQCETIYYRLDYPNGGTDPTAKDPGARWSRPGSTFTNITCDCMGGAAWIAGFDRYQPERFKHIYDGYINCDSIRMDIASGGRCFRRLARPEPGCMVMYGSVDYDGDGRRDRVGHIGTVISVPPDWDERAASSWQKLQIVDVAARAGRANAMTTGMPWFGMDRRGVAKDSWFVVSTMKP